MFEKGELQTKLKEKKISHKKLIFYLKRLLIFLLKYFLTNFKKVIFLYFRNLKIFSSI